MNVVQMTPSVESSPFDDFWTLYPRRVAKKYARECWNRIPPAKHIEILTSLAAWRAYWDRTGQEIAWLPHPSSWLNGERWEDEIPKVTQVTASASHVQSVMPKSERSEMPEQVRVMLAKLRSK
jgi:hypothetical protein